MVLRALIGAVAIAARIVQWVKDYRHGSAARNLLDERFAAKSKSWVQEEAPFNRR
jgi:hypothetical protein